MAHHGAADEAMFLQTQRKPVAERADGGVAPSKDKKASLSTALVRSMATPAGEGHPIVLHNVPRTDRIERQARPGRHRRPDQVLSGRAEALFFVISTNVEKFLVVRQPRQRSRISPVR